MTVLATSSNVYSTVVKAEYAPEIGFCKDALTVNDAATTFTVGAVLGRFLASPVATAAAVVGTGNGAIGTVTATAKAKIGTYLLRITKAATNAGDFVVSGPKGNVVGYGTVGTAFTSPDLTFTLADGSSDFVLNDTISIAVTGTEKYKKCIATATDGTADAVAVFVGDKTGNAGDLAVVANTDTTVLALTRGPAIVSKSALQLDASITGATLLAKLYADLAAVGILSNTTA